MTSYVPRSDRTRTVTEARLLAFINAQAPRFADGGIVDCGDYQPGPAECVCEEPCRYCHCKETE